MLFKHFLLLRMEKRSWGLALVLGHLIIISDNWVTLVHKHWCSMARWRDCSHSCRPILLSGHDCWVVYILRVRDRRWRIACVQPAKTCSADFIGRALIVRDHCRLICLHKPTVKTLSYFVGAGLPFLLLLLNLLQVIHRCALVFLALERWVKPAGRVVKGAISIWGDCNYATPRAHSFTRAHSISQAVSCLFRLIISIVKDSLQLLRCYRVPSTVYLRRHALELLNLDVCRWCATKIVGPRCRLAHSILRHCRIWVLHLDYTCGNFEHCCWCLRVNITRTLSSTPRWSLPLSTRALLFLVIAPRQLRMRLSLLTLALLWRCRRLIFRVVFEPGQEWINRSNGAYMPLQEHIAILKSCAILIFNHYYLFYYSTYYFKSTI